MTLETKNKFIYKYAKAVSPPPMNDKNNSFYKNLYIYIKRFIFVTNLATVG